MVDPYLDLLKVGGSMCVVGAIEPLDKSERGSTNVWEKEFGWITHRGDQRDSEMLISVP